MSKEVAFNSLSWDESILSYSFIGFFDLCMNQRISADR